MTHHGNTLKVHETKNDYGHIKIMGHIYNNCNRMEFCHLHLSFWYRVYSPVFAMVRLNLFGVWMDDKTMTLPTVSTHFMLNVSLGWTEKARQSGSERQADRQPPGVNGIYFNALFCGQRTHSVIMLDEN